MHERVSPDFSIGSGTVRKNIWKFGKIKEQFVACLPQLIFYLQGHFKFI
jgi:hypothetical protein